MKELIEKIDEIFYTTEECGITGTNKIINAEHLGDVGKLVEKLKKHLLEDKEQVEKLDEDWIDRAFDYSLGEERRRKISPMTKDYFRSIILKHLPPQKETVEIKRKKGKPENLDGVWYYRCGCGNIVGTDTYCSKCGKKLNGFYN